MRKVVIVSMAVTGILIILLMNLKDADNTYSNDVSSGSISTMDQSASLIPSPNIESKVLEKILIIEKDRRVPIQECSIDNEIYFRSNGSPNDLGDRLYNAEGDFIADCGGYFYLDPDNYESPPLICSKVTSCTTVHSAY